MTWNNELTRRLAKRRADNLFRRRITLTSAQGPRIATDEGSYLSFCSNDYLGLAGDPRLIHALQEAANIKGTQNAVRLAEALKVKATFAPCLANSMAIPFPMPREAPVINAILFSSNFIRYQIYESNILKFKGQTRAKQNPAIIIFEGILVELSVIALLPYPYN